jgi:hypothetical protein
MGNGDEFDIDSAGANLGGYERGCIIAFQSDAFLLGFARQPIKD